MKDKSIYQSKKAQRNFIARWRKCVVHFFQYFNLCHKDSNTFLIELQI